MKQFLDHMKEFYQDNPAILKPLKSLIPTLYREKKAGFYVNALKMKGKRGKDAVINYIIRYTGRPVMASSRILRLDHDQKRIRYYYEDHKTEERVEVEENILDFMKKCITHIPEP